MKTYRLFFCSGIGWVPADNKVHAENIGYELERDNCGRFIAAHQVPYNETLHFRFLHREDIENAH